MPSAWNPDTVRHVAQTFLQGRGLSEPHARLIRFYQNAIFHLPANHLALRIYGPEDAQKKAQRMVAFSRFLAERNFPSVRLSMLFEDQPIEFLGMQISVWEWIDENVAGAKQPYDFGALLRRLHSVTDTADFPAERFDPISKITERFLRLKGERRLPAGHVGALEAALARVVDLAGRLDETDIGTGLLHGDALIGNTIQASAGLVLLDFDSVGYGAREWDLAPTLVSATRFRQQDEVWRNFLAGYRADAASLGGIQAAGIVKQLSMTVALCLSRGLSREIDDEIDLRIRCWADWDLDTRWHSPSLRPAS